MHELQIQFELAVIHILMSRYAAAIRNALVGSPCVFFSKTNTQGLDMMTVGLSSLFQEISSI